MTFPSLLRRVAAGLAPSARATDTPAGVTTVGGTLFLDASHLDGYRDGQRTATRRHRADLKRFHLDLDHRFSKVGSAHLTARDPLGACQLPHRPVVEARLAAGALVCQRERLTHSHRARASTSLSGFGGRVEHSAVRGLIFGDSPAHSGFMGQEATDIGTAQADWQAGRPKPDRLLSNAPGVCTADRLESGGLERMSRLT